jgi:hypothetical protein
VRRRVAGALAPYTYQENKFSTSTVVAKSYDVSRKTLQQRTDDISSKLGSISKKRLLTPSKEESLTQWILSMDRRDMLPRIAIVREMARLLVAQRYKSTTTPPVGQNWVRKFINRHDTLKSKYNRKYDYQRAKYEDPKLIRAWFQRARATITKYDIHNNDIYNFDEIDFQMGVISTVKMITGSNRVDRPRTTQPGNRE